MLSKQRVLIAGKGFFFPWLPNFLSKMCLDMPGHILMLLIIDFGSYYAHSRPVIDMHILVL
jgi:hypothetical protein